jgi:hypothetical protein
VLAPFDVSGLFEIAPLLSIHHLSTGTRSSFPNPDKTVIFVHKLTRSCRHTSPTEWPLYWDPSLSFPLGWGFPWPTLPRAPRQGRRRSLERAACRQPRHAVVAVARPQLLPQQLMRHRVAVLLDLHVIVEASRRYGVRAGFRAYAAALVFVGRDDDDRAASGSSVLVEEQPPRAGRLDHHAGGVRHG